MRPVAQLVAVFVAAIFVAAVWQHMPSAGGRVAVVALVAFGVWAKALLLLKKAGRRQDRRDGAHP